MGPQQGVYGGLVVSVVAGNLLAIEQGRIAGPDRGGIGIYLIEELHDFLFVRNRDAESLDSQVRAISQERSEFIKWNSKGNVDHVQIRILEGGIVNDGAEAMSHRIRDHTINNS